MKVSSSMGTTPVRKPDVRTTGQRRHWVGLRWSPDRPVFDDLQAGAVDLFQVKAMSLDHKNECREDALWDVVRDGALIDPGNANSAIRNPGLSRHVGGGVGTNI